MDEATAQAIIDPIKHIAQSVIKEEMQQFREQLQETCLSAVETAFSHYIGSELFTTRIQHEISNSGAAPSIEALKPALEQTVEKIVAEKGAQHPDTTEEELLQKAKHLFRQSISSGSLDLKNIITKVVEQAVKSQTSMQSGGSAAVEQAVQQHLDASLKDDMKALIENKFQEFFSSDQLKELLDQKFRTIDLYLKTDLIPKVVKREINKAQVTE